MRRVGSGWNADNLVAWFLLPAEIKDVTGNKRENRISRKFKCQREK